jgi:ligand-binding SRPBCC domain-containing protein
MVHPMRFVKETVVAASAETVFAFHEAKDAFSRLQPPWQETEIVQPPTSLAVGTRVVLRVKVGPVWQTIEAEHVEYEPGRRFVDEMRRGPFRRWRHEHLVLPRDEASCVLRDDIEYELPLGRLGSLFGGWFAERSLRRLFEFRHRVTREACEGGAGD